MEKNIDNISVEADGDIIFITVAKYKLFYSYGKIGIDAYMLYSHLMFTARLQKTNSVHAKDIYLREGLGWGSDRLKKAKTLLIDLDLIKKIQKRDEKGHFVGNYIEVKTKTSPFEFNETPATLETGTPQTHARVTNNKCLNEKVKCLNKEEKNIFLGKTLNYWNSKENLITHDIDKIRKYIKPKHYDIINDMEFEEIKQSIDNYSIMYAEKENYLGVLKWTLPDFIFRHIHKFTDEMNPIEERKKKQFKTEYEIALENAQKLKI